LRNLKKKEMSEIYFKDGKRNSDSTSFVEYCLGYAVFILIGFVSLSMIKNVSRIKYISLSFLQFSFKVGFK